jgi:hypothetical protein
MFAPAPSAVMPSASRVAVGAALAVMLTAAATTVLADSTVNTGYFGGVAIKGYDPVAYFTENRAMKGSEQYAYCPSSDDLGHEGLIGKGGSGSLMVQSRPLSDGAASGASRSSLP